jgi:multidrug efflux pump
VPVITGGQFRYFALTTVYDMVDTRIAQKLSQLSGVGMVSLAGGQRPAIRVQMNPTALAAYKMSAEDVRSALIPPMPISPKAVLMGHIAPRC